MLQLVAVCCSMLYSVCYRVLQCVREPLSPQTALAPRSRSSKVRVCSFVCIATLPPAHTQHTQHTKHAHTHTRTHITHTTNTQQTLDTHTARVCPCLSFCLRNYFASCTRVHSRTTYTTRRKTHTQHTHTHIPHTHTTQHTRNIYTTHTHYTQHTHNTHTTPTQHVGHFRARILRSPVGGPPLQNNVKNDILPTFKVSFCEITRWPQGFQMQYLNFQKEPYISCSIF